MSMSIMSKNINNLFDNMIHTNDNKKVGKVASVTTSKKDPNKMPMRDSSTLSQLVYTNEKYNKREIPRNDDKKPLYDIIKKRNTDTYHFNQLIDNDIKNTLKKSWNFIPMNLKKNLLNDYFTKNKINIEPSVLSTLIRSKNIVKYNKLTQEIENVKL